MAAEANTSARVETVVSFCISLAPAPPAHLYAKLGGKARSLLRLAAAGLAVPPATVVTTDLFAALRAGGPALPARLTAPDALAALARAEAALAGAPWPDGFEDELAGALAALAPGADARFAVRSSATVEDEAGVLAPGLFTSRVDVARADVPAALRAVLASALAPGVGAYLDARGGAAALGIAVLIHPFIAGDAAGAAACEPSGVPPLVEVHAGGGLTAAARTRIADAARTLAAAHGPVELEWVARGDAPTFLQLRPYRAPARTAWPGMARLADPSSDTNRPWRWDAAHNPVPLSPAQAGLVALVDDRCRIGLRQRVVDGYLFYAVDDDRADAASGAPDALRTLREIAAPMLSQSASTLEEALETFTTLYEPLFGSVQPAARAARDALVAFLTRHGLEPGPRLPALLAGVASAATDRMRCARALAHAATPETRATALAIYLALFGDEGPRWDVAAPTWREVPASLERLLLGAHIDLPTASAEADLAAASVRAALPLTALADWDACLAAGRAAVAVAEDDDALYARLQGHVRRALLREGERLRAADVLAEAEDVFWLPLEMVRGDARGDVPLTTADAARAIVAAVRADEAARGQPPPIEWAARTPALRGAPAAIGAGDLPGDVVRGTPGSPGARIGRVRLHSEAADACGPSEVLVARTLLPTELPLLAPIALVVETGGALDHVAAQARERGIPAIVGAAGATQILRDGDEVLVDADAGLVVRLAPTTIH